ncbi:Uncharacterized protein FWK35_00030067 [Aphis craccivora]|uniref:Uncharacterized protein n=1 Tax=Aphis craccivora TaxID=307492 RepID=A0A6G0VWR7_APHCR|nr:Uncharacterized protein FWK35_00030067 [Aphis craccivora]
MKNNNNNNISILLIYFIDGIESQIYVTKNQLNENGISIPEIPDIYNSIKHFCWSDGATSFILEKYAEYLPKVGPLKLFLKKKRTFATNIC